MKYFREFGQNGEPGAGYVADGMPWTEADIRDRFPSTVEISEEDQNLYVTGQYIRDPETGSPVEKPVHVPTAEEKLAAIRAKRDRLLDATTWIFQRQQTGTESQKLPADQYQLWVDYWVELRDFPATCDHDNPVWPEQPDTETE